MLADYESSTLDLRDPGAYRDLSKPMGAQTSSRLINLRERSNVMELDDPITGRPMPKFLYSTHYSSAGTALRYLLRLPPLTEHAIEFQGGLDHADRMLHSVSGAWKSASTGSGDVNELTPEWYCLPEFLINRRLCGAYSIYYVVLTPPHRRMDLGVRSCGQRVDDVQLPPWARGSAYEFIRIQREALESDTVSRQLHLWIDLIFGVRQHGELAAEAGTHSDSEQTPCPAQQEQHCSYTHWCFALLHRQLVLPVVLRGALQERQR